MAQLSVFMRGTKVVARATFKVPATEAGTLTDPTTVIFTEREREASSSTPYQYGVAAEVTRVSAGVFEWARVPAEGEWHLHVQGTGAAHGAAEVGFKIEHSRALV